MSKSVGGAYLPRQNYDRTGATDSNGTYASGTFTGSTVTSPTISAPVLSGSVTGTYTLAGTPTLTSPTINSPVISSLSSNISVIDATGGFASDTYLVGSKIAMPAGGFVVGHRYNCWFDMVKTAAGTAALAVTLRIGTAGTTADAAICTFTFGAGTAAADTGTFEVYAHFRTVGSGTAAVVAGVCWCSHALAATGLISTGASGAGQIQNTSSGFDSTVAATYIGLSVNGGASFSGTNKVVEAELRGF